ncbi:MAG TPA: helix-turn-helix domain-containing protein [Verrucomicrobiae bacterium]|nr:helix-turn-helix domain-containing protein [Verrucomicrobiae bacterium]
MPLGQIIRDLREKRRLKQGDLAHSIGVSPQAVSKWERNENDPDLPALVKLARLFGVSTDCLLGVNDPKPGTVEATVMATSIRNFARKSHALSAPQLAEWANGIFFHLTEAALKQDGIPVKYVGDGFLCFFSGPGHAERAVAAARHARRVIQLPELVIALHAGDIYVGSAGHPDYSSRDICGETVNLAFLVMDAVGTHCASGMGATETVAAALGAKSGLKKTTNYYVRRARQSIKLYEVTP